MLALSHTNLLKLVIVVDDDVDPEDWRQIEQALATRMRGERDIFVMPGLKADRCEPQQVDLTVSKVGIVATRQPGDRKDAGGFEAARVPHDILERVRKELESY
jgi:2,5-furandicarboxylate decarboxylase 1